MYVREARRNGVHSRYAMGRARFLAASAVVFLLAAAAPESVLPASDILEITATLDAVDASQ